MDFAHQLEGRLTFAVPKKGRLQQAALDLLQGSDLQFRREHRLDIALVLGLEVALVFLPAADIPAFVGEGRVDLGITGRDQVAEHDANAPAATSAGVEEIFDLGFGKCRLQVQVPEVGQFSDPKDLIGKSISTSFTGLTAKYFAGLEGVPLESRGEDEDELFLRRKLKTRIRHLSGSVEAACALGVADGIVDLVESGETMRAARLKSIDTVMQSSAVLIKSSTSTNSKLINLIVSRIKGVISAQKYVLCQYNIPRSTLDAAVQITPGKRAPTITALEEPDWIAVSAMVPKANVAIVMDDLISVGATDVLVLPIINTRTD